MPSSIQQIQASFDPIEDRILLRLHTGDQSLQAWLTRRYTQLLIPALQGQHPKTGAPLLPAKQHAMAQMSSQKMQQEGNFDSPYQEPETVEKPLGEVPILLAKMTFKDLEGDNPQIVLEPDQGKGIALSYRPELTGALSKILQQAILKADWQLVLDPILQLPEQVTLQ
ncbi:hypothetical protein [Thiosulfativibrio zosterae]|uniref:Uncharacterized protein n=1 Tax=Thiosulfativibrio zosterae TaxID=2675053 RepID=A0A6F8PJY1_9GAMM|nr:hypothetical protein [Thiosulfativibrio zosterae]BBP42405.1 hypothetical protein THMIRHAT_01510 [Thiosulfativibrio zosterae]